ncbi:MAG TPA: hypothetical protein PKY95_10975, partial [candidate division Zixibacteria bacterium]|nr:hypothetical protein [candidate division Zixibacteria bacterium]
MKYTFVSLALCLIFAGSILAEDPLPTQPRGKSIREYLTPDGRFDLDAARRSGYEGPLDIEGFRSGIDPATRAPLFQPASPAFPADHPDDIFWDNSISPSIPGVDSAVRAAIV